MSHYDRGFPPPREMITNALLALLTGCILLALFLIGLWYVWPENGVAALDEPATRAILVSP